MDRQFLTSAQVAEFIDRGYIVLRQAFSADVASPWAHPRFQLDGDD
jgi:hypothetical protein